MSTEKITKTDNSKSKAQIAQELKEKAADNGDRKIMKKNAEMCNNGEGVPVNKEEDDDKSRLKKKMKLKYISDSDSSDDEMMSDNYSSSSSFMIELEACDESADKN